MCLSGIEKLLSEKGIDDFVQRSDVIRQRTETWHPIRNHAKVTGSSVNKAVL